MRLARSRRSWAGSSGSSDVATGCSASAGLGHPSTNASASRVARFAVVAGGGHLPHVEQPAATFEVLDAFLGASGR